MTSTPSTTLMHAHVARQRSAIAFDWVLLLSQREWACSLHPPAPANMQLARSPHCLLSVAHRHRHQRLDARHWAQQCSARPARSPVLLAGGLTSQTGGADATARLAVSAAPPVLTPAVLSTNREHRRSSYASITYTMVIYTFGLASSKVCSEGAGAGPQHMGWHSSCGKRHVREITGGRRCCAGCQEPRQTCHGRGSRCREAGGCR